MIKQFNANRGRLKRHLRMRSHMEGSQAPPRLSVFRSGHHIYAQIIDDTTGQTLAAASSLEETLRSSKPAVKGAATGVQGRAGGAGAQAEREAEADPAQRRGPEHAPQ